MQNENPLATPGSEGEEIWEAASARTTPAEVLEIDTPDRDDYCKNDSDKKIMTNTMEVRIVLPAAIASGRREIHVKVVHCDNGHIYVDKANPSNPFTREGGALSSIYSGVIDTQVTDIKVNDNKYFEIYDSGSSALLAVSWKKNGDKCDFANDRVKFILVESC